MVGGTSCSSCLRSHLAHAQLHKPPAPYSLTPLHTPHPLLQVGNHTLSIIKEPTVIAINQDTLGVQARRISSRKPRNTSLLEEHHAVALLAPCQAANPLQNWRYHPPPATPRVDTLYVAPCNTSDPAQQLSVSGGALRSHWTGLCLDKGASSGFIARFSPCQHPPSSGQQAQLDRASAHLHVGGESHCLDVFDFSGPNVFIGGCKRPGNDDANQRFGVRPEFPGMLWSGVSHGRLKGDQCLTSRAPYFGGLLVTSTEEGEQWCLVANAIDFTAAKCDPGSTAVTVNNGFMLKKVDALGDEQTFEVLSAQNEYNGQPKKLSSSGINDFGSSGPLPHTRWSFPGGGSFFFNPETANGSALQSTNTAIIDDDNEGHVTKGGKFCLELSSASALEVWAGALSGGRWVAVLFNRSPAPDDIRVDFNDLPDNRHRDHDTQHHHHHDHHGLPRVQNGQTFDAYEVWSKTRRVGVTGSLTMTVGAHDVALVVLCPPGDTGCDLRGTDLS